MLEDINPKTKNLNQALVDCTVRVLGEDNKSFDYKLDQSLLFSGDRKDHPYIKNYLASLDTIEEQTIVVLNKDGSERISPIKIPSGKLPVWRLRTRGGGKIGFQRFIIIGIVDKSSQELHCLDMDGNQNIVTSPPDHGPTKKVELLPEELARL